MSVGSVFKNFGHAIATGAKAFVGFSQKLPGVIEKLQPVEQDAAIILGAVAGPQAAKIADLSFHVLGSVAETLETAGSAVDAKGLNVQLDQQTINDIRDVAALLKTMLAAKGTPAPLPGAAAATA